MKDSAMCIVGGMVTWQRKLVCIDNSSIYLEKWLIMEIVCYIGEKERGSKVLKKKESMYKNSMIE